LPYLKRLAIAVPPLTAAVLTLHFVLYVNIILSVACGICMYCTGLSYLPNPNILVYLLYQVTRTCICYMFLNVVFMLQFCIETL